MKKFLTKAALSAFTLAIFAGCSDSAANETQTAGTTAANGGGETAAAVAQTEAAPAASGFDTSKYISVVSREEGSGTRGAFIELFKVEVSTDDGKKDMTTKEAIIADKTDVLMTNVSGDVYAVGYISLGSVNDTVKAVSIDGVAANVDNIKNGSYKIQRPFNIAVGKGGVTEAAQDFIDFILSAEGQAVVSGSYIAVDENAPAYAGSQSSGKIVVAGSSSVTPIMEKLREAYIALNPGVAIEVQMTDSSAGMTSAINGTCDIGMASRALKDSELAELNDTAIAIDGIAVIVNNGNPTSDLSSETVRQIFTGEIEKWSDV
jgi:phosphate transport system substrate-binding protein